MMNENPSPQEPNHSPEDEFGGLPWEDAEVLAELQDTAPRLQPRPAFAARLENELRLAGQTAPWRLRINPGGWLPGLAWTAATLLLVIGLSWAIGSLRTQPIPAGGEVGTPLVAPTTEQPAPTQTETAIALPLDVPTPLPAQAGYQEYTSPYLPGATLILQTKFPDAPAQASIFALPSAVELTLNAILQTAQRLGVQGTVYAMPTYGGSAVAYMVSDGVQRIQFFGTDPNSFNYIANYSQFGSLSLDLPPEADQIAAAEAFLKAHGLLTFEYRASTIPSWPGTVAIDPLINGHLQLSVRSTVQIGPSGQVSSVYYHNPQLTQINDYPIRSAAEAWQKVLEGKAQTGVQITSSSQTTNTLQAWVRRFEPGQRVEMFGFPEVNWPVDRKLPALVYLNGYRLTGDAAQQLAQTPASAQLVQVFGQAGTAEGGSLVFEVEGFQTSAFDIQYLEGTVARNDGLAYLDTGSQRLLLPDLPADVPEQEAVYVNGIILLEPELSMEWWAVQSGQAGSGGGGGGGSSIGGVDPNTPVQPSPTPVPLPQKDERMEGAVGLPHITLYQYPSGDTRSEYFLHLQDGPYAGQDLQLSGHGTQGIENDINQPVKVWGFFSPDNSSPWIFVVERFEPLYPQVEYKAWVGVYEVVELEGQSVFRFTALDGQKYILGSSVNGKAADLSDVAPGRWLIVEGAIYPDETFGGLPVLTDSTHMQVGAPEEITTYQTILNQPVTIYMDEALGSQKMYITNIELAYFYPEAEIAAVYPYVQPVWRFSGQDNKGQDFNILVAALPDYMLK